MFLSEGHLFKSEHEFEPNKLSFKHISKIHKSMPKQVQLTKRWGPFRLKRKIIIFSYHKCGTVLFRNIFNSLCSRMGLSMTVVYGQASSESFEGDVTLLEHSQFHERDLPDDFIGIHLSRDPRDILVSGYKYHIRCAEPWAKHTYRHGEDLLFPAVPYVLEARSLGERESYVALLDGLSYQSKVGSLGQFEGLAFEYENYTKWTLEDISRWSPRSNVYECRMEVLYEDYEGWFRDMSDFIGGNLLFCKLFLYYASKQNILLRSDAQIQANAYVASRKISKWHSFLPESVVSRFYVDWPEFFDDSNNCKLPMGRVNG